MNATAVTKLAILLAVMLLLLRARGRADAEDIETGTRVARNARVVICALARDVEPVFAKNRARMETLGSHFSEYKIVVFENDSADNSRELFRRWANENPNVVLLDCPGVEECRHGSVPAASLGAAGRVRKMALFRERCLTKVRTSYSSFEYMMMFDFDLDGDLDTDGLFYGLSRDPSRWGAFACYGMDDDVTGTVYDPGAFRSYHERHSDAPSATLGNKWANRVDRARCLVGCAATPMYEVASSFNGMAIYQLDKVIESNCSYVHDSYNAAGECEHITFHRGLNDAGHPIYLNGRWSGRFKNPKKNLLRTSPQHAFPPSR